MDARVAALLDEREIREVVFRYCRGIDRRDLELVRGCYHADARDRHGSFEGGVDAFLEWVDALLARYEWTVHFVANVLIEPGRDPGVAAVESYGIALHQSHDPRPHLNLATAFRYLDRFERRDEQWRIADRVAVADGAIRIPVESRWALPDDQPKGRRDGRDELYALLRSVRGRDRA